MHSINDIETEKYALPVNYDSFSKREQRKFILEYLNEIKVAYIFKDFLIMDFNSERTKLSIPPIMEEKFRIHSFI